MKLEQVSSYRVWKIIYVCCCGDCESCRFDDREYPTVCYAPNHDIALEVINLFRKDERYEKEFVLCTEETLIEVTDTKLVDRIISSVEGIKSCVEDYSNYQQDVDEDENSEKEGE